LLSVIIAVAVTTYLVISSSMAFFEAEASKVASQLDNAPQLRSIMEQTARFASSFVLMVFGLLLLALAISSVVLWLEDVACR
jgi:pantoate kinase